MNSKLILFFSTIPTPYVNEFLLNVNLKLPNGYKMIAVYEKDNVGFREHWNTQRKDCFVIPQNGRKRFLLNLLNNSNPILCILTLYNKMSSLIVKNWCNSKNIEYYFGPHEILKKSPFIFKNYLRNSYYKYIVKKASGIITMGNESIRRISKLVPNKRIISLPYSFSLDNLLSYDKRKQNNELVFLMSGRLYDFRNPLLGIRCFASLLNQNNDQKIKLIISGKGPLHEKCIQFIKELNIQDHVEWMNPDFIDWYDIHNIYKYADVLLALQDFGTWGLIIQEAMAAGLGIVSTNTIQAADNLIINGYNGFLTGFDEFEIVNKMNKYVRDMELSALHGRRSREIVTQLDVKVVALNFVDFIRCSIF